MGYPFLVGEGFEVAPINKHKGHNLPHWDRPGWPNFITFRLGDALPQSIINEAKIEIEREVVRERKRKGSALTPQEVERIRKKLAGRLEKHLDSGYGSCILREPANACIVENALLFFNEERYELLCWSVMPNHAHVILETKEEFPLPKVIKSWKTFTTNAINKNGGRQGNLWQIEYFDHMVRNGEGLRRFADYVYENPTKAGLRSWPFRGVMDLTERIELLNRLAVE